MTLASWITSVRFILAPLIYWQLTAGAPRGLIWAVGLLVFAGISDILDGWAARSRNEVSELGKTLDPLSDKIVIISMLLGLNKSWDLPWWLPMVYIVKELGQVFAGVYLLKEFKQLIPANKWGKSSTFGFFLGFLFFFVNHPLGLVILVLAFIVSLYALYTYWLAYRVLKANKDSNPES